MPHDDQERWEATLPGMPGQGAARLAAPPNATLSLFNPEAREGIDAEMDLRAYWDIIWKRRVLVSAVFAVVFVLGVAGTFLMTPIYRATTLLQIDREPPKVLTSTDSLQPAELLTGDEFFQTQYGLLKSVSLAQRVASILGIADDPNAMKAMGWRPNLNRFAGPQANSQLRLVRDAVSLIEKHLKVEPVRGSRLVQVEFESRDPQLSARIANTMAENFIALNLERRFQAASYARQFLEEKLAQMKTKLEDSERAAVAYASSQHIINIPVQGAANQTGGSTESVTAADLSALDQDLAAATNQRILAEQRWRQVKATPGHSLPEVVANSTVQQLLLDRAKVGAEYQHDLANYKPDHPTMLQLKAQMNELDGAIQTQISHAQQSVGAQYETALNQEKSLKLEVDQLERSLINLSQRSIQYNILQREVDTNRSLYDGLLQRYKEVGVAGGVGTNNVSVVDRAQPPLKPAIPNIPVNIAVSAALGLLLGVMAAFGIELLDQGISVPSDVETKLHLKTIGAVPKLARGIAPRQALADPSSALSEAFNSIRTVLQFSTSDGAPRTLLFTSSRPDEGKSTCALGVALSFARLGARVLLIDADLRDPTLHRTLGVSNATGLSKFLEGSAGFAEVVRPTDSANLSVAPSGPLPPSPSEYLAGPALKAFLKEAAEAFDLVMVDGPPVVGLSDTPSISAAVVGTVFVIEAAAVRTPQANDAIRRLSAVDSRLLGVILSKHTAGAGAYGYEYSYRHGKPNGRS